MLEDDLVTVIDSLNGTVFLRDCAKNNSQGIIEELPQ
jgi:hypothetical protein